MKKPKSVKTTFSTYSIGNIKGQGGSGVVYEATDEDGNLFAIKFLDSGKASYEKLKRFKNEFLFCSKNKHKNIITVLDHGITDEESPFFVMPLYDNSLRSLIGRLSPKNSLMIFNKIMDGLEAAHKLGVVHRDVKPENILILSQANELVIADFGIAEFEQDELYTAIDTKDGTRLANFQYAAPEQRVRGRKVDSRADIYSLGLILNELITGEIPYGTNFKKIGDVVNELSYLDAIVERMLEQNPDARFGAIEEIKHELIARNEEKITLQKIHQLERTVIPATEIDDPIVNDPMRIISVDWTNNLLTLVLNHPVSQLWHWALLNMGNFTFLQGKEPRNFNFSLNKVSIEAAPYEAQQIIDYFKQWLPSANELYKQKLQQNLFDDQRKQQEEIQRRIQKEKERADVLGRLKI